MASGSSGWVNSGSKGFDFATDDILCSYEDYGNQDSYNGPQSGPGIGAENLSKEFHKTRMARSSVLSLSSYSPPDDSFTHDITSIVERTMKKYTDSLMRFLEGISSRLSQLELYCYNIDKTIGEMRSNLAHDHREADEKLKFIEKHLQEVHRSIRILRDKQELAETQKEVSKLQLANKDSTSSTHSQCNDDRASTPVFDTKTLDNPSDTHNLQLALALPHLVTPQPQPQPALQGLPQLHPQQYYMPTLTQPPNTPVPSPAPVPASVAVPPPAPGQGQYMPPKLTQSHLNPAPPAQPFSQYQQVWPQQLPHAVQPQQQTSIRQPASGPYASYSLTQQPNKQPSPPPSETLASSMPIEVSYSGLPQQPIQASGYGKPPTRTPQQPPPQQMKTSYGSTKPGDVYPVSGPCLPVLHPPSRHTIYGSSEPGRSHYPSQQHPFPPSVYASQQTLGTPNPSALKPGPPPHFMRNHPYGDLIDKLVNMGFRGDHVVGLIQRMEEAGQPIDFNSVLDRLNVQSSGVPQRGW